MLSFIVIGRNEGWRLQKSLSAICRIAPKELNQPYEIIYVDSKSSDDSINLARQYADKIFLVTGDCSAAIGRNIGAKEAKGDILLFLDGDMELHEGVLRTILDENGHLIYPFLSGTEYEFLYDNEWNKIQEAPRGSLTGLMAIENEIWFRVGGMDNRYVRSEDYDLIWRVQKTGIRYKRMKQLWVNHYTRYYAVRSEPFSVCKYDALLTRKHFFYKPAFKYFFTRHYSCFLLVFTLIMLAITFNLWAMLPYVLILIYRSVRVMQRTPVGLRFSKVLVDRFLKDCAFLYFFLTYYPKQPVLSYSKI
jgi:glycosyltransferase involved in cell wall biosynthesis